MPSNSIAGVNVKIGADLTDLKKKLGEVGDTVESELEPAASSVHDLRDSFKETATSTKDSSVNIQAIAQALQTIGTALLGFAKGSIEEALKVNPETTASYEAISGAFTDLKVALGEGLLASLEGAAPKVTGVLNSITSFAKENPDTAGLLLGIVGAVGMLGSAAVTAAPLLTLFNISLAPISGTALAVAGAIVGLIAILALLSTTLDEIGDKASGVAEEMSTMDTTTQQIVENGIGELEVVDKEVHFVPVWDEDLGDFIEQNAVWDENKYDPLTGAKGYWTPVEVAISQTTDAVAEMGEAVTETMNTTKSTSEQALEIFDNMQTSVGGLTESLTTEGLGEALTSAQELIESEAFQNFANQPVPEEVGTSWTSFGGAVQATSDGMASLDTQLSSGEVSGAIASTGQVASTAAAGFDALTTAIYGAIDAYLALLSIKSSGGGGGKGGSMNMFKGSGGPVYAGSTYIVGEQDPELFTPHTNGTIIPNDQLTGKGRQIVVNFNGDVIGDANSIYSLVNRAAKAAIRQEVRAAA